MLAVDIETKMTYDEYINWLAYFGIKEKRQKKMAKDQELKNKVKNGKGR